MLSFDNISIVNFITITISIIALVFSGLRISFNKRKWKLDLIFNVFTIFNSDTDLLKTFSKIEKKTFNYVSRSDITKPDLDIEEDENELPTQEKEKNQIYMLARHFSIIAIAKYKGMIKIEDITLIEYYIRTIGNDKNVRKLLNDYKKEQNIEDFNVHPFGAFLKLSDELKECKCV